MTTITFRLISVTVTVVINLILASIVYKNNYKSATNKIFGGLAIVTSLWLIDDFLSVDPKFFHDGLIWVRFSVFLAIPQIALFFLLAHTLPSEKVQLSRKKLRLLELTGVALMVDSLSPFMFTKTTFTHGKIVASVGSGIIPFVLFALFLSILAIVTLYLKLKRSANFIKEQFRLVFVGIVLMLGLLFGTVLIPVAIFKDSYFVTLIPLYTIVFLGLTTYSIVAKKLFDIRAAVARSIGYLLIVATMSLAYSVLIFGVINVILTSSKQQTLRQAISVLLVSLLALSFQSIKRFFDKVTNRLFYRDAYDAQAFLDRFNKVIVSTYELEPLLRKIAVLIEQNIKPDYAVFFIKETQFTGQRIIGATNNVRFSKSELASCIDGISPVYNNKIIVTENIREEYEKLRTTLEGLNISIVTKLSSSKRDIGVGNLILGSKRNGNIYNTQDLMVLEIITNELVIAVQNALRFEEIEQFNLTLQQKVDEATNKLRRANEKLRALDETKDDFISMASHQLRTPLTSVKGYISMVLDGDVGKITKEQKDMLNQAFFSSQRMVYLIADLLNVSRLKTGKFVIEPSLVNLAEVVQQELSQLGETASSKSLKLTYDKPKSFPTLMLDDTKTRQVIMNFVDNAIYYTPSGGEVHVKLIDNQASVELRVEDNGIGVPKAEQHHLFTKFYRAGNARKARPDGTGLGLFMAKKVILAEGGSIIFESTEGKGSTFGFVFPKTKLAPKSSEALPLHEPEKDKELAPA
ncbi:MAG: sensor histidine kinase [Candidatus Saccharimonadales bacterium]